ncbi:spore germination protein GerPE [Bacillus kwashiorkori]|uniref:spore germination protein GerPE n=1 Tax=Bacillus kwashiorkori TaxID=1522318 RepID=UPI000783C77D|nr:spore germination protein GerPE [Bacillus kwashiorkori]
MLKRTSFVKRVNVKTINTSSLLQIGDSSEIDSLSETLAVMREVPLFFGYEGHFRFPVFSRDITYPPLYEPLIKLTTNINGKISVDEVNVIGTGASAVIHIGNSKNVFLENRRKHIRDLRKS